MKIIGYIFAILGIIGIAAYTIPQVKNIVPIPSQIDDITLIIISSALVLIGIFIILRSGGRRAHASHKREVPIYHGKHIVGYRRR